MDAIDGVAASGEAGMHLFDAAGANARLVQGAPSPLSDAPSLRVRPITNGSDVAFRRVSDSEATSGGDRRFQARAVDSTLQLLGSLSANGGVVSVDFAHDLNCPSSTLDMRRVGESIVFYAVGSAGADVVAIAARPWAIDAQGRELRTWYEIEGSTLRQFIDTSASSGLIVFDPTYNFPNCIGYWADALTEYYLDIATTDTPHCPPVMMFGGRHPYYPVEAFETNVANDFGTIMVKQDGECSWSPDTGWAWDFQVPCKAHDYCYDLRRAGFSGTVSDVNCDVYFFWIMEAHCNNRVFSGDCRIVRDTYYSIVYPYNVDITPAAIRLEPWHSFVLRPGGPTMCMDVEASGTANLTRILQFDCNETANQLFRLRPFAGQPGKFTIEPSHTSGRCVTVAATHHLLYLWECGNYSNQAFSPQHVGADFLFTLRPLPTYPNNCVDVPYSSLGTVHLQEYACFQTTNQQWIL